MHDSAEMILALLDRGEEVRFRAGGQSMTPTIRDGEIVGVRPLRGNPPLRGAIVLYRAHDRLILHRLIKITGNTAETIADAAWSGKETIPLAAIAGTGVRVMRKDRSRRLDRGLDRWLGMARYWLRPVRRLLIKPLMRHARASSPEKRTKASTASIERVK